MSPFVLVRFCGDCGAITTDEFCEGGGSGVKGEFVADTFDDVVDVDVDDIEFDTVICGFIVAIVCGDMREKCDDRWVNCKC